MVSSVAADLRMALDPVMLAAAAGIEPDEWQRLLLRSSAPRILMNCSRQSGKSTVAALLAVHTSIYAAGSLVLLLSPSQRQSAELFRKCVEVYQALGRPVPAEAESALRIELENGSRIVSLPGTKEETVRGFSGVNLLVIDEAARVSSDLYQSVRPMLAVSQGRLLALSTPYGTRGWWYEAWVSAEAWQRFEIPATMCPRISPDFLAEEERTIGRWWFEQEYLCKFLDAKTAAFTRAEVDRAFGEEVEQWAL